MAHHQAVLQELTSKQPELKHIEEVHDRSAPVVEPGLQLKASVKPQLLAELAGGHALKHVEPEAIADRSEPHVEPGTTLTAGPSRKEVLESAAALGAHTAVVKELQSVASAGAIHLHHVEHVHDASKPAIPAGTTVHTWDKRAFLSEIAAPKPLQHVAQEQVADRSQPTIEPDVTLATTQSHRDLLIEIRTSSPSQLRHPEEVHDRSDPVVAKTAAMRLSSHALADE